ncbi:Tannase/feruloyl esterase [Podospora fimiseda]|uniref:Carboxylic ester hydrolase n=1 Tax=Podospora fimiseda TaxID=252190 RepID=A0AAN6YPR3_9PEZI|nr:Tannase/feruloyl esterase [Podospora fimiseda]
MASLLHKRFRLGPTSARLIPLLLLAMAPLLYIVLSLFLSSPISAQQCSQPLRCNDATFQPFLSTGVTIEKTFEVPARGTYGEGPSNLGHPANAIGIPNVCAVTVRVKASEKSTYRFGLFLPTRCAWNQKFLAVGNGAQSGGINWADMGQGPHYNMATLSTDTGHNSTGDDLKWGMNDKDKLQDWGYRALKGSVEIGKKLVAGFYGKPITYSYWSGCSTGGRQGLKQMQIAPGSFDGVLVGAPAWDTKHLFPWIARLAATNWNASNPEGFFGGREWQLLNASIWDQCISRPEVKNGTAADPFGGCVLDWNKMICPPQGAGDPNACLTKPQADTARKWYADWKDANNKLVFPGLPLGSEPAWPQVWGIGADSREPKFDSDYIRYWLYNDESYSLGDYDEEQVLADSRRINPGNATADQFDVTEFKKRNGKVLMYHGTVDGVVVPGTSQVYYDETVKKMGSVDEFMRLFYVPGMYHCSFTDATINAPWIMGGAGQAVALQQLLGLGKGWSVPYFEGNGKYDALVALMDWVEKKQPVEKLIATTWETSGKMKQRPICKYPAKAKYNRGDVYSADSWICA